jgi:hypothetical protein
MIVGFATAAGLVNQLIEARRETSPASESSLAKLQLTDRGTSQGVGISPLLANIFLHYVLDL